MRTEAIRISARLLFWLLALLGLMSLALNLGLWQKNTDIRGPFQAWGSGARSFVLLAPDFDAPSWSDQQGDDVSHPDRSTVTLLINGQIMGPAHAPHPTIMQGDGFSHWGKHILFSLPPGTDNSPETIVTIRYDVTPPSWVVMALIIASALLAWPAHGEKIRSFFDRHQRMVQRPEISVSARLAQTAAVFIITSVISLLILSMTPPNVGEDHFQIGRNLRSTGALTIEGSPSIFRPPGYPGFVAASLWVGDTISVPKDLPSERSVQRDQRIVVIAQAMLLGAMAAALFVWASLWSGFILAAGIAVAATLNPFSLALANLLSYHLLFVVLVTFSTLGLFLLRGFAPSSALAAGAAGLVWGLTSLVKPVTLVIPFFLALLALIRRPMRSAFRSIGWIVIGMILVVGPYVGRNYLITGQPIITAQGGFAFWGSSIETIGPNGPFLRWIPIWYKYGMPIYSRVTGSAEYSIATLNAHALQLNAEFSKEARQNIIAAPEIYLYNVLHNFISFNLDTMEFWNKVFVAPNKRLFHRLSEIWIITLMALAAAGAVWGGVRSDDDTMTLIAVYLGIVVAHSISFANEQYTIAKLPLIFLGFALLMRQLESMPRYRVLARAAACSMAGFGLLISVLAVI